MPKRDIHFAPPLDIARISGSLRAKVDAFFDELIAEGHRVSFQWRHMAQAAYVRQFQKGLRRTFKQGGYYDLDVWHINRELKAIVELHEKQRDDPAVNPQDDFDSLARGRWEAIQALTESKKALKETEQCLAEVLQHLQSANRRNEKLKRRLRSAILNNPGKQNQ